MQTLFGINVSNISEKIITPQITNNTPYSIKMYLHRLKNVEFYVLTNERTFRKEFDL
jgi:hypothetical protein